MVNAKLEIGASVVVKKLRFLPLRLARLFDKRAGMAGSIVSVEPGKYSRELLYGVVFDTNKGAAISTGVYFSDQLEFPTSCGAQSQ